MSQMVFDEGLASRLEHIYRGRDMVRRRQLARDALGAAPRGWIIDADGDFFFGCIQFCFTATRVR
jgi:hypothetical protein